VELQIQGVMNQWKRMHVYNNTEQGHGEIVAGGCVLQMVLQMTAGKGKTG
jgi:hypothetical protein